MLIVGQYQFTDSSESLDYYVSAMRTASCPELHEEAQLIDETWEY
jgi:hypothetical protein